mmetsp:Transcript_32437/g.52270  ORF Transcript_32437/g.52270 Transcript_32437/m.52270 type:complete len:219 (+) Transcript_32437:1060-1716(+)
MRWRRNPTHLSLASTVWNQSRGASPWLFSCPWRTAANRVFLPSHPDRPGLGLLGFFPCPWTSWTCSSFPSASALAPHVLSDHPRRLRCPSYRACRRSKNQTWPSPHLETVRPRQTTRPGKRCSLSPHARRPLQRSDPRAFQAVSQEIPGRREWWSAAHRRTLGQFPKKAPMMSCAPWSCSCRRISILNWTLRRLITADQVGPRGSRMNSIATLVGWPR